MVHEAYAGDRQRSVEELRADLSHALTGMLHQRELEACVKAPKPEARTLRQSGKELTEPVAHNEGKFSQHFAKQRKAGRIFTKENSPENQSNDYLRHSCLLLLINAYC